MSWVHLLAAGLLRKPLRTGLTALTLATAYVLLGVLTPMLALFTSAGSRGDGGRLVVQPRHSIVDFLPERHAAAVARLAGNDAAVAHMTWFGGTFRDPANVFPRWAVPPAAFLAVTPELQLPAEQRSAFTRTRNGAIVGRRTAERFRLHVGDSMVLQPDIWPNRSGAPWRFEVVGIFDADDSRVDTTAMYIDYAYFDAARAWGNGQVSVILVRPPAGRDALELARRIDAAFANGADETTTASERAYALSFANRLGDVGMMLSVVLISVLLTIAAVCVHTIAEGVRERRVELATLRALGFTRRHVAALVLCETLALVLLGAVPGLAGAQALLLLGRDALGSLAVSMGNAVTLVGIGTSVLALAVLAGLPPVWRLRREHIADALRSAQGG